MRTTTGILSAGTKVKIRGERGTYTVQYIDEFEDREPEVTMIGGRFKKPDAWRTKRLSEVRPLTAAEARVR